MSVDVPTRLVECHGCSIFIGPGFLEFESQVDSRTGYELCSACFESWERQRKKGMNPLRSVERSSLRGRRS